MWLIFSCPVVKQIKTCIFESPIITVLWLYVFLGADAASGQQRQHNCFVWLHKPHCQNPTPYFTCFPSNWKWWEEIVWLPTAMFMLSGNIHFIISFIWEHLSQRGYSPICKLAEKRAACLLNSRFTAAPNLWLGVMAFKAAAPPAGLHRLCVRSEGKVSVRWNLPLRNSFPLCLTLDTLAEHGNAFWFIFSYCFAFCCSLLLCFFFFFFILVFTSLPAL